MSLRFLSTNALKKESGYFSLEDALLLGIAPDGGLFFPEAIPQLSKEWIAALPTMKEGEILTGIARAWLSGSMPDAEIDRITLDAVNFQTPLHHLSKNLSVLELFHGPTLAFKDYGARFMARVLAHFLRKAGRRQTILVATSGDTGSAVAQGFLGVPEINVAVLYPKGRISHLQEQQITTLGQNITAFEVDGSFDDCQRLVKAAFADKELSDELGLNSANSINIGRLIPQTFYYFLGYAKLGEDAQPPVFCVPSGNLGNLTAGVFAKKMGLPVSKFIAALNRNDVFERYLHTGRFEPRDSVQTIANAMDVGNPSNFARLLTCYGADAALTAAEIEAFSCNDEEVRQAIHGVYEKFGYVLDPHTAVGYVAITKSGAARKDAHCILLSTAHPAKFRESVEPLIGKRIELPQALREAMERKKEAIQVSNDLATLKGYLLSRIS